MSPRIRPPRVATIVVATVTRCACCRGWIDAESTVAQVSIDDGANGQGKTIKPKICAGCGRAIAAVFDSAA